MIETKRRGRLATVASAQPFSRKLVKVKRKARLGRNPFTGQALKIAAKTGLKFRVSKTAKDASGAVLPLKASYSRVVRRTFREQNQKSRLRYSRRFRSTCAVYSHTSPIGPTSESKAASNSRRRNCHGCPSANRTVTRRSSAFSTAPPRRPAPPFWFILARNASQRFKRNFAPRRFSCSAHVIMLMIPAASASQLQPPRVGGRHVAAQQEGGILRHEWQKRSLHWILH
jgi:hypothetical protein